MSNTNNNPFLNERPRKRHLWGLWIPLIIIGAIIIIPVGLVLVVFLNPYSNDNGVKEAIQPQALFENALTGMFDNCRAEENQSIDLVITQEDLNKVLFGVKEDLNTTVKSNTNDLVVINQFDLDIGENYVFDVEATAMNFFKTHATMTMSVRGDQDITVVEGGTEVTKKGFVFSLLDVKVGRLGGLQGLLGSVGLDIGSLLGGLGLSWTWDGTTNTLSYTYEALVNDIATKAKLGTGLFVDLFKTFFTEGFISFPHQAGKINGSISLDTFKFNDKYGNKGLTIAEKDENNKLMTTATAEEVEAYLNNGIITEADATANGLSSLKEAAHAVHKFLMFGIDFLSANEATYINHLAATPAFTPRLGGKTVEEFSAARRLAYFGETNTSFVDNITEGAKAKVEDLVNAAKDEEEMTAEQLYAFYMNGGTPEELKQKSKFYALFQGIKDQINSTGKTWYLYGGTQTRYYFDNSIKHWDKVYAKVEDASEQSALDSENGFRMINYSGDIWYVDVDPDYTKLTFNNGSTEHTDSFTLDSSKRYYAAAGGWEALPTTIVERDHDIAVYDSNIHDLVKDNTGIIGFGFPFVNTASNGKYKYSYTMVDNIYATTNVSEEGTYIALIFGLNINGTETQLVLPCKQDTFATTSEYVYGLSFDVGSATMYFGNEEVPGVKSTLEEIMSNVTDISSFLSFDKNSEGKVTSMTMKIDLTNVVTNGNFKTFHDHLSSDDPSDEFACNAELFLDIIPTANSIEEQATKGNGRLQIEVGYRSKTA